MHGHHSLDLTQCDFCVGFLEGRGVQASYKEPARPDASNTHRNPGYTSTSRHAWGRSQSKVFKTEKPPVTEKVIKNKLFVLWFYLYLKLGKLFSCTLHKEVLFAVAFKKSKTRLCNTHLQLLLVIRTLRNTVSTDCTANI